MKKDISIIEKRCSGCVSCTLICPTKAIKMVQNEKGFYYPEVNDRLCIQCGLCLKTCEVNNEERNTPLNCYAFFLGNKKRMASQSGGAFTAVAEHFLKEGGVVYGAAKDKDLNVKYIRINSRLQLKKIKGSKYVQADMGQIAQLVEKDLIKNKKVLFSGTPCHVAGIYQYIKTKGIPLNGLYTCDLVCHGVPSPGIYKNYTSDIKRRYGDFIKNFNFRDKKNPGGWYGHVCSFSVKNKAIISNNYRDIFYSHLCLRESCYQCSYASLNRVSDITVGDYWGIEKRHPDMFDNKGTSMVLINTEKGKDIFESVKEQGKWIETSLEECMQPNLQHPTEKPVKYSEFWEDYAALGFVPTVKKYCNYNEDNDIQAERNWIKTIFKGKGN